MATWQKPDPSLIDLFEEHLPRDGRIERRRMFGCPSAFVHGNMATGVFKDLIFVRLPAEVRERLEAAHGPLPFEPMPGRASKSYMRLPDDIVADEDELAAFLATAIGFTAALPPKEKKVRKTLR
ncbi:MAG: hypothetical protein JWP35_271 [Caulobacter sp.]|nr:hypothetical protein [Caulobacter sp.]